MRFLGKPEEKEGYILEISVDGRPRRTLESAAGGVEEVLTGIGSKELMAYGLCRSCEC